MAAKAKTQASSTHQLKPKVVRTGVHAKTKSSKNRKSTNYKKPYVGQG